MEAISQDRPVSGHPSPSRVHTGACFLCARLLQPITVDLRSLAVLRLTLAGLLLFDLARRAPAAWETPWPGLPAVVLGVPVGLLLLVGYRSRWMAGVAAALLIAPALEPLMNGIGPLELGAGEVALAMLLFWAAFVPIGARYGLDSAMNTHPPAHDRYASLTTAALLATFLLINLGPALTPSTGLFAGPATADAAEAGELGDALPTAPYTVTAAHLRTLDWLPPAIPLDIDWAILAALAMLLMPIFHGVLRGIATFAMAALHLLIAPDFPVPLLTPVLAAGWLALVPPAFWEALFTRLRTPARLGLTIWYHGNDPTHLRRVRLLATFLLIPETPLRPSDENLDIDVYRRQRDSWVVTDHLGYRYNRFRALAAVCRVSPLAFPLAPIFRAGFVEPVGDWLYDLGKRHGGPLTRLADALTLRAIPPRVPLWQQVLAIVLFAAVAAPLLLDLPGIGR